MALYRAGNQSYEEGDYAAAVASFQQAHLLSERPELLFNAANAFERWGCYADAAALLERYAAGATPERKVVLDRRIGRLRQRSSQNDPEVPPCPTPTVATGPVPASSEPATSAALPEASTTNTPRRTPDASDGVLETNSILGYSLLGVSAVSLGAGLFFGLSSMSDTRSVENRCLSSGVCPETASDALDGSQSGALAADVGVGVGLVALGAGLYFLLGGESDPGAPRVSARLTPDGAGVGVRGCF